MLTEVAKQRPRWERVAYELRGRQRDHHLPTMRDGHESGRTIGSTAEVVALASLGFPPVDPHTNPQRFRECPRLNAKYPLRSQRRLKRVMRSREHRVHAIPCRLHDMTRIRFDRLAHDRIVTSKHPPHRLRMLLPQTCRTLKIGEQERDRPRRQLCHPTSSTQPVCK